MFKVLQSIPRHQFKLVFSRASGPGGQNVNKLNSKASIRLSAAEWASAGWVPERVRQAKDFAYLTKSGDVLVSSDLTRSQKLNIDDCFRKLAAKIALASEVPAEPSDESIERWARIRAKTSKHRLENKRINKEKKLSRRAL